MVQSWGWSPNIEQVYVVSSQNNTSSINQNEKKYESCNLSTHACKCSTLNNADILPNLLFKLFLRDFSEVVVLEHSKLMRLFNNIPSTNASKGQWPHPIVYRSERNLEIKIASSY